MAEEAGVVGLYGRMDLRKEQGFQNNRSSRDSRPGHVFVAELRNSERENSDAARKCFY